MDEAAVVVLSMVSVLINMVVTFIATAGAGFLVLWFAERTFEVRKERDRRREEARKEVQRAKTYLGLLRDEVKGITDLIPKQVETVESKEWGMAVPIVTPVWDVVQQSGELVSLVNPQVLEQTAFFYEQLEYARHILDFLILSWLVPDSVVAIKKKRAEMVGAVAGSLRSAEGVGKKLLESLEGEQAE